MSGDANRNDLVALGKAAFKEGRYEEAVAHLAPAAKADLTDPGALALLGASYSFLGRHAAAIAAFQRALELGPDSAQAHHNLAVALEQAGQPDDAAVHYREATALDPDHAPSARALQRLAAESPAEPAPTPPPQPPPAPVRRRVWSRRAVLVLLGAVIVVAAGGAGAGIGWKFSAASRRRQAEERAQQCRRNLEQLTRALLDYARAHDDTLPASDAWVGAAMAYGAADAGEELPLHCPSDRGSEISYAMNPVLSEKRLGEIGAPRETILLYEVRKGRAVRRHRGAALYGFVDGHVEQLSEAPDHIWRLKRPAGIGRVDPGRIPPPPPPEESTAPTGPPEEQADTGPLPPEAAPPVGPELGP